VLGGALEWSCPMSEVAELAQGKDANFGKITGQVGPTQGDYAHTTQHNSVWRRLRSQEPFTNYTRLIIRP
jgi:hypothetical protein